MTTTGLEPDELERRADEAERRGDLDTALRLRFRAGLAASTTPAWCASAPG